MTIALARRIALGGLLLVVTLSVGGCYYGPVPYYAYPRYAYRPAPYWGGGYGYGYGYHPYYR